MARTIGLTLAAASMACAGLAWRPATAQPPAEALASHRAVYELSLAPSRGKSSTVSARGRILYDFSGNACDGYALQFRQVSELDNGEGKVSLSDLRSTTWEDAAAKRFVYKSENFLNQEPTGSVEGEAERHADKIAVSLFKPADKRFDLEPAVAFPTEHMRRIIAAARAGKSLLEVPLYDGSDKGEKVYNTFAVIGRAIGPGERVPTDAAAQPELAELRRWPVTVSYFEQGGPGGDQTPAYSIRFEVYENGVSRALLLDYGDFAISGELSSLKLRETKPCK
jgi:hypothetical protein